MKKTTFNKNSNKDSSEPGGLVLTGFLFMFLVIFILGCLAVPKIVSPAVEYTREHLYNTVEVHKYGGITHTIYAFANIDTYDAQSNDKNNDMLNPYLRNRSYQIKFVTLMNP